MHWLSALGYSQCGKKAAALWKTPQGTSSVHFQGTVGCSTVSTRTFPEDWGTCSTDPGTGTLAWVWFHAWLNPIQLQPAAKAHELTFPFLPSPALLLIRQLQESQLSESHHQLQSIKGRGMCSLDQEDWEAAHFLVAANVMLGWFINHGSYVTHHLHTWTSTT